MRPGSSFVPSQGIAKQECPDNISFYLVYVVLTQPREDDVGLYDSVSRITPVLISNHDGDFLYLRPVSYDT
jgi:hypothetical protein